MFLWVRQRVASFTCGYLLVETYNRAQNELSGPDGRVDPTKRAHAGVLQQQRSWLPHWLSTPIPTAPVARPMDDAREWIVEYDVLSAVVMAAIIFAGGMSGIAGAASAVVLECSDDGPRVYQDLKKQLAGVEREFEAAQKSAKR